MAATPSRSNAGAVPSQAKFSLEREMPGIGRDAHHQHRQEQPQAGCRGEPDTKRDR